MKKLIAVCVGLGLVAAVGAAFAQAPAQTDQPKAEKNAKSKKKSDKRKAEEPKNQKPKKK